MARTIKALRLSGGTSSTLRQMLAATPPLNASLRSHGTSVERGVPSKR